MFYFPLVLKGNEFTTGRLFILPGAIKTPMEAKKTGTSAQKRRGLVASHASPASIRREEERPVAGHPGRAEGAAAELGVPHAGVPVRAAGRRPRSCSGRLGRAGRRWGSPKIPTMGWWMETWTEHRRVSGDG